MPEMIPEKEAYDIATKTSPREADGSKLESVEDITDAVGEGEDDLGGLRSMRGVRSVARRALVSMVADGIAALASIVGGASHGRRGESGGDQKGVTLREYVYSATWVYKG